MVMRYFGCMRGTRVTPDDLCYLLNLSMIYILWLIGLYHEHQLYILDLV